MSVGFSSQYAKFWEQLQSKLLCLLSIFANYAEKFFLWGLYAMLECEAAKKQNQRVADWKKNRKIDRYVDR